MRPVPTALVGPACLCKFRVTELAGIGGLRCVLTPQLLWVPLVCVSSELRELWLLSRQDQSAGMDLVHLIIFSLHNIF